MTLQEYLQQHLSEMATQDANFRERFEDKAKSMQNCLRYITQQARKQAVNNCAAISDSDVLQMAVHYYQEKDVEPTADTPQATVTTAPEPTKPQPVLIPKTKGKKKKKTNDDSLQLNLFD